MSVRHGLEPEPDRRMRETGVQQAMENRHSSCFYVFFTKDFSHINYQILNETKVILKCSPVHRIRKVALFPIFLNLELLFCETFDCKE